MAKIKKGYNWKWVVILISLTFLFNSIVYAIVNVSKNTCLRVEHTTTTKQGQKRLIKAIARSLRRRFIKILFPEIRSFLDSEASSKTTYDRYINGIRILDDKYSISDIKPGTVVIVFTKHSSYGFTEAESFLDKIFDKAKSENRRIVFYIECGVPTKMKVVHEIFPNLDAKLIFKNPSYREHFNNRVIQRHKYLSTYFDLIAEGDVDIGTISDSDLETQVGFIFSQSLYLFGKAKNGYNVKLIPEQPQIETYIVGLKNAQKGRFGKRQDVSKLRDGDFSELISRTSNSDDYIIAIRGAYHLFLIDILKQKEVSIIPFITKKALQEILDELRLLAKILPEYLETFHKIQHFI